MRDDLNSGGLMGKLTGYFQAVVRGGIVDDEDPYIVDAFLQDALDAAAKKATVLITGNCYVDACHN